MLLHKNEHDSTEIPPPPYTEDDDYDVFLFYASLSPGLLIPVNEPVENPYRLTKHRQQLDHVLPSYSLSSSLESTSVAHVQTVDGLELETAGDLLSVRLPSSTRFDAHQRIDVYSLLHQHGPLYQTSSSLKLERMMF